MTNDIIKRKLKEVGINYRETSKYFLIPREINMKQDKAPKWFTSYMDEHNIQLNKRLDRIDKRLENIENTPTMKNELKK